MRYLSNSAESALPLAKAFEEIVTNRRAIKAFSDKPIPAEVLRKVLDLAQVRTT